MQASIVDLRYHMNDVMSALERNEVVTIVYHGKIKGEIHPHHEKIALQKVANHPFFGMTTNKKISVKKQMENLRGDRYRDL